MRKISARIEMQGTRGLSGTWNLGARQTTSRWYNATTATSHTPAAAARTVKRVKGANATVA